MRFSRGLKVFVATFVLVALGMLVRIYYVRIEEDNDAQRATHMRYLAANGGPIARDIKDIQASIEEAAVSFGEHDDIVAQCSRTKFALFVFEESLFRAERASEALMAATPLARKEAHKEFHRALNALDENKQLFMEELDRLTAFLKELKTTPRGQSI